MVRVLVVNKSKIEFIMRVKKKDILRVLAFLRLYNRKVRKADRHKNSINIFCSLEGSKQLDSIMNNINKN